MAAVWIRSELLALIFIQHVGLPIEVSVYCQKPNARCNQYKRQIINSGILQQSGELRECKTQTMF